MMIKEDIIEQLMQSAKDILNVELSELEAELIVDSAEVVQVKAGATICEVGSR